MMIPKQLHMFLSVADPSALKNTKLPKLLDNDNDIITDYLEKDTDNLKCIKNFNIYSHWLPNNLFVVDYNKIINKINEKKYIHNDMMKVLCYLPIKDLLELSEGLNPGAKLEVKYLNMHLEFQGPDGDVSNGIEALADAIKSNTGVLSNTGKYQYDTFSPTYNLLDIELSLYNKLIEGIGL